MPNKKMPVKIKGSLRNPVQATPTSHRMLSLLHTQKIAYSLYKKTNPEICISRFFPFYQLQINQLNAAPPIAATSVNGTPIRIKSFVDTL